MAGTTLIRRQYASVEQAATAIWDHTLVHGGGTFAESTGEVLEYDRGYMVSRAEDTMKIAREEERDVAINLIAAFIQRQPVWGNGLKDNIGTWLDTETGIIHVDAVELVDNVFDALAAAEARNEIAIWDNKHSAEIRVS